MAQIGQFNYMQLQIIGYVLHYHVLHKVLQLPNKFVSAKCKKWHSAFALEASPVENKEVVHPQKLC